VNKRKWKRIFYVSIVLNILFSAYGIHKSYWKFIRWKKNEIEDLGVLAENRSDRLIVEKKILRSDSTGVILTFGQSNSANYGQGKYECHNNVFNYFNGDVYIAIEPLLGADGAGCSVWTRLADMLIDSGVYKKVILIPIGINGASIECWANGTCKEKLLKILKQIKKDSINITQVIWHQGETDNFNNTNKETYKTNLAKILFQIREYGIKTKFYVCVASYHPYAVDKINGIDTVIQNAQIEFSHENSGTKAGLNTDDINLAFDRWDGVHFSKRGLDKFSKGLYDMLVEKKANRYKRQIMTINK